MTSHNPNRPVVIGIGCEPGTDDYSRIMNQAQQDFHRVRPRKKRDLWHIYADMPKDETSKTFDELFQIYLKRYVEVGWVYEDTVS